MSVPHLGVIDGRRDIARGRFQTDRRVATPFSTEAMFTSLAFSADGALLYAAGKSKYICLYDVENRVLLNKIQISHNKSFDGVLDILSSRNLTEAGDMDLIDDADSDEGASEQVLPLMGLEDDRDLPGSSVAKKPIIQTRSLSLCPTGKRLAAATTEGVLIFSDQCADLFDPVDLDEEVTPQAVQASLEKGRFHEALIMALRLRDDARIHQCLMSTPVTQIPSVVRQIPPGYSAPLLDAIADALRSTPDLELLLNWAKSCCSAFGAELMKTQSSVGASVKNLHQVLDTFHTELQSLVQSNLYLMQYIHTAAQKGTCPEVVPIEDE